MHIAHPAATIEYNSGDTHQGTVQSRKVRWNRDGCSMYLTCTHGHSVGAIFPASGTAVSG